MKKVTIIALAILLFSFSAVNGQKKSAKAKKQTKTPAKSDISKEILAEINDIRMNPKKYVKFLEKARKNLKGKMLLLESGERLQTIEGIAAIDDAIRDLEKVSGLQPLKLSDDLSEVADIQLTDLKENIYLRHVGKDGSDLDTRISRIGVVGNARAENISYYSKEAQMIVFSLVVDDGVYNRIHRKNILNSKFKEVGIAFGNSKNDVAVCVLVFADKFMKLKDKPLAF